MRYTYSKKDFNLAKQFTDAVLSMDKLYRMNLDSSEESFSKEGIVPVVISDLKYDEIGNWPDIKKLLLSIYQDYKTIDNDIRKNYMFEQISSVIAIGEWVFENKSFDYRQLVSNLLFVDHNPITKRQIEKDKNDINNLLSDKNYKGSFEEKLINWKKDNTVRPEKLQDVLNTLGNEAKEKALDAGFNEVEDIDVKFVVEHDVPYSGYCDYLKKEIYINGDMEYTYPGLKHLICHETYPGHMTHMQIRKVLADQGEVPVDSLLVITNTASSSIFEGIADNGTKFIGWYENKDDIIARLYQNLTSKMSLTSAHMIHEENYDIEAVKKYFKETLQVTDSVVDSKIRFLTYSFRKPYIYSYWRGNEAVENLYNKVAKQDVTSFLKYIYRNMHSINTLNEFI